MPSAQTLLVAAQAATFLGLGALFFSQGDHRLGIAQVLLAGVTWVVYV